MASESVVFYDGVCALCHGLVRWIVRHDAARKLRYAPLQGETARAMSAVHRDWPHAIDTVIFVHEGRVWMRSRAVIMILGQLGWPWRAALVFMVLPAWLFDLGYRCIASVRYRVFGRYDACDIPTPAHNELFLP